MIEYSICYMRAKRLHEIAECQQEHAAINRLHAFRGTEADVLLAASMFERVGEGANAQELLRSCLGAEVG